MSVYELLTPKKNWTDLDVNSLTTDQLIINRIISRGPSSIIFSPGTTVFGAANIVDATLGFTLVGGTQTATFPSKAQLDTFLGDIPEGSKFTTNVYVKGATTVIFNFGANTETYDAQTTITMTQFKSQVITYVKGLSTWTIFAISPA